MRTKLGIVIQAAKFSPHCELRFTRHNRWLKEFSIFHISKFSPHKLWLYLDIIRPRMIWLAGTRMAFRRGTCPPKTNCRLCPISLNLFCYLPTLPSDTPWDKAINRWVAPGPHTYLHLVSNYLLYQLRVLVAHTYTHYYIIFFLVVFRSGSTIFHLTR